MSVRFHSVLLHNKTGLEIPLKIEAPIHHIVYGPVKVPPESTVTVNVFRNDCPSVRLIADDVDHGATQDFVVASSGSGRQSYLESVEVDFNVGDITGIATVRTS